MKLAKLSYRRWFFCLLSLLVLGGILGVAFNAVIDPFGLTGWASIEGLNRKKPAFFFHQRLGKPSIVQARKPHAILVGASQVQMGFDPAHVGFKQPAYNFSVPMMTLYEALRFVQHALVSGHLEQVVLGIYPGMFRTREAPNPNFNESVLAADSRGRPTWFQGNLGRLRVLASLDTLFASLQTILGQHYSPLGQDFTILPDGRLDTANRRAVSRRHGGLFEVFRVVRARRSAPRPKETWVDPVTKRSSFDLFREILQVCRRAGIQLHIVIAPRHAAAKVEGDHEERLLWRGKLVESSLAEAKAAESAPFPLWDFDLVSSYTTEPIPAKSDLSAELRWFWDPVHFKLELGNLILDRVFAQPGAPQDFGVRLLPAE